MEVGGYTHDENQYKRVNTTVVAGINRLCVDALANIEGDYVDDSIFNVGIDSGLAIGGVYSADNVDLNDFGVFAINAAREQITQAKLADTLGAGLTSTLVGADQALDVNVVQTTSAVTTDIDDDSIAAGQTSQVVLPLLYGYDATGGSWERLQTDGSGSLDVNVTGGAIAGLIFDIDDGAVVAGQTPQLILNENYGYDTTNTDWSRMLVEMDNGAVAINQTPQLVLNESKRDDS